MSRPDKIITYHKPTGKGQHSNLSSSHSSLILPGLIFNGTCPPNQNVPRTENIHLSPHLEPSSSSWNPLLKSQSWSSMTSFPTSISATMTSITHYLGSWVPFPTPNEVRQLAALQNLPTGKFSVDPKREEYIFPPEEDLVRRRYPVIFHGMNPITLPRPSQILPAPCQRCTPGGWMKARSSFAWSTCGGAPCRRPLRR